MNRNTRFFGNSKDAIDVIVLLHNACYYSTFLPVSVLSLHLVIDLASNQPKDKTVENCLFAHIHSATDTKEEKAIHLEVVYQCFPIINIKSGINLIT